MNAKNPRTNIFGNDCVPVEAASFAQQVDVQRKRADVPNVSYVAFDLPEYARSGIGRAVGRVVRYLPQGEAVQGALGSGVVCIASILGVGFSREHLLYEDMNVEVLGNSLDSLIELLPKSILNYLQSESWSFDSLALAGALFHANKHYQRDALSADDVQSFTQSVLDFPLRANYLESDPLRTLMYMMSDDEIDWSKVIF